MKLNWNEEVKKFIQKNWLPGDQFTIEDLYKNEEFFQKKFPMNNHVKDKLRQIMQHLRDAEIIEFINNKGSYRLL